MLQESELVQERLIKEDLLQQTEIVSKFHETESKVLLLSLEKGINY